MVNQTIPRLKDATQSKEMVLSYHVPQHKYHALYVKKLMEKNFTIPQPYASIKNNQTTSNQDQPSTIKGTIKNIDNHLKSNLQGQITHH